MRAISGTMRRHQRATPRYLIDSADRYCSKQLLISAFILFFVGGRPDRF